MQLSDTVKEINEFNKNVIEKFASRQAYQEIKGHYIPIIWNNISDESVMDLDKRKYYVQSYEFIMLGFLIDEEEFTVSPAVNRLIQVFETDGKIITKKTRGRNEPQELKQIVLDFPSGTTEVVRTFNLTDSLSLINTTNVLSFDIYIDNDYYGSDLTTIQISTNDNVKFIVTKSDNTLESTITFESFNNS
jgi:hypothetical protein